jgi:nucleotide-binding universal stress UspA family protein
MENQLITLLRVTTPQLGSFVKDKLEEHGIEVFFTNEGTSVSNKYNPDEVLLKIKAGQSEKTIARLLQIHKDYDLDKVKDDASFADFKKILVPVKLSENCFELCKYAIALAKKQNAEIKLLFAYEDPTFNEPDRHTASWERHVKMELKEAFAKAQLKLVNFSKELKKQIPKELMNSVKLHYRMLKGTPVNVITDACKRYNPDLILMGTRTKSSKKGEFLSQTIIKVLDRTPFPVLAVPFDAAYKGKDKINVMYATNFYDGDNSALNKLLKLLEAYDKKIQCVHIDLHNDPQIQKKVDELNKILEDKYSEHNIKCIPYASDSIVNGLESFVAANDIDIISLSKVKHSALYKMFHSNLSAKLVTTEKIPILIFPV